MQSLAQNTTVKLGIDHNISSMKVIQARYDLNQTILSIKQNIQARYGSLVPYLKLQLKNQKGGLVAQLDDDMRPLGFYGAETGMYIHVIDLNPQSIHKQIESFEGVEKYKMSQQDYMKLPQNFRKWKNQMMKKHPQLLEQQKKIAVGQHDPDYLGQLAALIKVGSRCKLNTGPRGQVAYVGKIVDLGAGFFVGVRLDQPYGNSSGSVKGVKYFEANQKYGIFVRPNILQIGDFPVLDLDDEL